MCAASAEPFAVVDSFVRSCVLWLAHLLARFTWCLAARCREYFWLARTDGQPFSAVSDAKYVRTQHKVGLVRSGCCWNLHSASDCQLAACACVFTAQPELKAEDKEKEPFAGPPRAVQLIARTNKKWVLTEEGASLLRSARLNAKSTPFGVLAIVGVSRAGKSFLMSQLAGNHQGSPCLATLRAVSGADNVVFGPLSVSVLKQIDPRQRHPRYLGLERAH